MNGVTQRELSFLLLLWGVSDPRIAELRELPRFFSIKLHSEAQVSGRLSTSGGRSPRHAQNPFSGKRMKTLSITHHALSPPSLHHHLYIIHFINWLQGFYRITMSLKRPFVSKSDVKQWFTTTGHSVPSTITLVLENFVLKDDGEKYLTQSLDGHQSTSFNSKYLDKIYPGNKNIGNSALSDSENVT